MNFRAFSSRVAVWNVARFEKEDRTREDRPRSERGTESDRVGYAGKDNDARHQLSLLQGYEQLTSCEACEV
jgi:hypothetical protein